MKHAVQAVKHAAQAAGSAPPHSFPVSTSTKCELEIIATEITSHTMLAY